MHKISKEIQEIELKIKDILLKNKGKYKVNFPKDIKDYSLVEKFFKSFKKLDMDYFLARPDIDSLADAIIRQFLFNMFNFNFWRYPEKGINEKTKYPRSQELLEIIDNVFIDKNPDYTDLNFDLTFRMGDPRLLYVLKGKFCEKYNDFLFKEWKKYISFVDDLIELIQDDKKRNHFMTFIYNIVNDEIDYSEMLKKMNEFLPNVYGNDIFNKRENMFVYGIIHEFETRNLDTNIKINIPELFAIDYRIPSILFEEGLFEIIKLEEDDELYLELHDICNMELVKDDNIEQLFRASAYKTLLDIKRTEKFNNIKLDSFLFWTSKNNNSQHILVDTTDY